MSKNISKKVTWKSMLCICLSPNVSMPEPKRVVPGSPKRLSIYDVSNQDFEFSISEISNSFGLNLHSFTLDELRIMTNNFSYTGNFIDEGGFGAVYKGVVDGNLRPGLLKAQSVAVKVLDLDGSQGHKEWLAEVILLGQLRHPHLVKLIGYCCENEQRVLVYEYMSRGNLENQLFERCDVALSWLTRMKIAVGAAKGLAFLHEANKPVILRDFKASNVLLDDDFNAKVSDFGFARDGPEGDKSHVTTKNILGTQGYVAPEYIMTGHLTTMSDVYSYGVVLLELLTGKRSMDSNRPRKEQSLVEWARSILKDPQKVDLIMDSKLKGQFSPHGAKVAATLACQCVSHQSKSRPTMSIVVKTLEPLLGMNDNPRHFVYDVPKEDEKEVAKQIKEKKQNDGNRKRHHALHTKLGIRIIKPISCIHLLD